MKEAIG